MTKNSTWYYTLLPTIKCCHRINLDYIFGHLYMYTYFTPVTDGECEVIQMAAAITFEAFGQVS